MFKNKINEIEIEGSFSWNFKLHLKFSRKITFFNSKSHTLYLNYQNNSGNEVHGLNSHDDLIYNSKNLQFVQLPRLIFLSLIYLM